MRQSYSYPQQYISKLRLTTLCALLIWIAVPVSVSFAQCSCGGPPLLGSFQTPATGVGVWQFGLTYEYSSVGDYVTGITELDDDIRDRSVQSGLLQIDRGFTSRLTLGVIASLLKQSRTTVSPAGAGEFLSASGVGDGVFLAKYRVSPGDLSSPFQLSLGGGVKIPLGKSTLRNVNGVLIAPDMQPGTGSIDGILWSSLSYELGATRKFSAFGSFTYRFTGTNDEFAESLRAYQFGNELVSDVGLAYRATDNVALTLGARYRHRSADNERAAELPNTGGQWINLTPGANLTLRNGLSVRATGQVPLYRDLEGTQYTTSYSVSLSLFYSLFPKSQNNGGGFGS